MRFTYNGREYDSADMLCVKVRDGDYPCLFVARDYSAFVMLSASPWVGVTSECLTAERVRELAQVYAPLRAVVGELDRRAGGQAGM